MVLAAAIVLWLGQAFAALVDSEDTRDEQLLLLVGLGVLLAPVSALRFYFSNRFALEVAAWLRQSAFGRALLSAEGSGEKIVADAMTVRTILASEALPSARNLILFLGAMALMFATSSYLAAVTLLLTLPILALVSLGVRSMRATASNWRSREADLHAQLQERVRLRRIIQAFRRERKEVAAFAELSATAHLSFSAYLRRRALLSALVIATLAAAVAAVFWQGAGMVGDGELSRGQLAAFLFYGVLAAVSLAGFTESATVWGRLEAALEGLRSQPLPRSQPPDRKLKFASLEFRNVSFAYPGERRRTLHGVSFTLKKGQSHALVGQSGSGKSTIFYLILGFFKPDAGSILLNGESIESLGADAVRGVFGLVPQDSAMLSGSIRHNITYAAEPPPSPKQINDCLKATGAGFVHRLAEGMDTRISGKTDLSEGQKQRLAWARAILSGAEVLLLDEATSALDTLNEGAIIKNLKRHTCLVIAHRPSTMRAMERITVIENGRVLASGGHGSLRKACPLYRHLSSQPFV